MSATTLFAGALLLVVAATAHAQSLADIARREEARRGAILRPAKVYTNADLVADLTREALTASPEVSAAATSVGPPATEDVDVAEAAPDAPTAEPPLNEPLWRARAISFRTALEKASEKLAAVSKPSTSSDPREQARLAELKQRAEAVSKEAEDALRRFEARAAATKVPWAWIAPQ